MTPKQTRFVQEYLIDLNATQAAIRAGYSKKYANDQAAQLLSNVDIAAAIEAGKLARSERTQVDADWVLNRLVHEAEADIADLYTVAGELKPVHEWPEIWRQGLVTGLEVNELFEGQGESRQQIGVVKKVRFSDRIRRIELIGKHVRVNAFQDIVEHKGLDALADRMERALREEERFRVIDAHFEEVPVVAPSAPEPAPTPLPVKPAPVAPPCEVERVPPPPKPVYCPIMPHVSAPAYGGLATVQPFPADVGSADVNYDPLD